MEMSLGEVQDIFTQREGEGGIQCVQLAEDTMGAA